MQTQKNIEQDSMLYLDKNRTLAELVIYATFVIFSSHAESTRWTVLPRPSR